MTAGSSCTTPLRIGVNLSYLRPGGVGGSETYLRSLIQHAHTIQGTSWTLVGAAEVTQTIDVPSVERFHLPIGRSTPPWKRVLIERKYAPQFTRDVDVLLNPANFGVLSKRLAAPQVAVVHDLQHRDIRGTIPARIRAERELMFRATLKRCDGIIAVSEFTAQRLRAAYRVRDDRVHVIHEAAKELAPDTPLEHHETRELRRVLSTHPDYVVYPAMFTPHKNHRLLIQALAEAPQDLGLVLTGKATPHEQGLRRLARSYGVEHRVFFMGYVSEALLTTLLGGARALVYPSLYEGFGLPVLDAMRLGTPVLASNLASIPEIAGDAALLLPNDAHAWSAALRDARHNSHLCEELSRRGLSRVEEFSWDRTAQEMVALLGRVASVH